MIEALCADCGASFMVRPSAMKQGRRHCSNVCRYRAKTLSPQARFESFFDKRPNECWMWKGAIQYMGYGAFNLGSRITASRASWLIYKGKIPPGLQVCHACDNPPCVNPDHLFLGTAKENASDMMKKGRARPHPGETNWNSKLTDDAVRLIRNSSASGVDLARRFGVTKNQIYAVRNGHSWKHVT